MNITLAEALRDVDLQPGRTYRCEVRGQEVEVRVLTPMHVGEETSSAIPNSDVMVDAWVEFPEPLCRSRGVSRQGPPLLPDIPAIPRDEDSP